MKNRVTKKQRKRWHVRNLRRALKRTFEIHKLSTRRIYRGRYGDGIANKI